MINLCLSVFEVWYITGWFIYLVSTSSNVLLFFFSLKWFSLVLSSFPSFFQTFLNQIPLSSSTALLIFN